MAYSYAPKALPQYGAHPEYDEYHDIFVKCRDCYLGEDRIKDQGENYLPALPDQTGSSYDVYKTRATFLNSFNRTITGLVGSVMRRPSIVNVPESMEDLMEDVNLGGYDIQTFISHLLRETLITGRAGILVDREENGRPYFSIYSAESIIDWNVSRNNVPAKISLMEEEGRDKKPQVRELLIEDGRYLVKILEDGEEEDEIVVSQEIEPQKRGTTLDFIPFTLINSDNPGWSVCHPPLLDLANVCLSHYRTSADLEAGRHYVSIPTPYIIGVDPEEFDTGIAIGPTSAIIVPNEQAKIGFLEFAGVGLKSLEQALTQKEHQMSVLGARVLERVRTGVESAEAARIHQASELSILSSLVTEVEKGVTKALKHMAEWENQNSDDVSVKINRDFVDAKLNARDLQALVDAYLKGAVSLDTLVYNFKAGEILEDSTSVDEEISRIKPNERGSDVRRTDNLDGEF